MWTYDPKSRCIKVSMNAIFGEHEFDVNAKFMQSMKLYGPWTKKICLHQILKSFNQIKRRIVHI